MTPRRLGCILPRPPCPLAGCAAALLPLCLVFLLAACDGEPFSSPDTEVPGDALHVGYAEVQAPWRVGAKPGQVGTAALPERNRLLARSITELLPILSPQALDPAAHIAGATDWVLRMLAERVDTVKAGRYAALFEAGRGIEEPPVMKALVLRRGAAKAAIVRADLYVGHEQLHRRVASLIENETGIDRDHLFFVASHNHSVPHAVSPSPGVWILADAFDPRHFVYVTHAIAGAVVEADRSLRPAALRTSVSEFREVQHNVIGPGTVRMKNPDGIEETIPVGYPRDHFDADLVSLRFDDPETGAPLVFLFVFGMHPESLPEGHGISSGEWPAHVERKLRQRTGAPAIWLPGALGDSEPDRGFNHPEHRFMRQSFDAMEVMSEIIAGAAERAFAAAGAAPGTTDPRLEQVVADIPGVEGFPVPTSAFLGPRFPMVRILHDSATLRLHVLRLGDALLLGAPAEITTDLAFNIKSRVDREANNVYQGYEWPQAPEWVKARVRRNFASDEIEPHKGAPIPVVVSHVNGYAGYIVTAWEYENRAHYRQEMTAFGPETANHVASALVAMVRELEGGARFAVELPSWHPLDLDGVASIQSFLGALDEPVVELSRALPAADPARVGLALVEPPAEAARGARVTFSWAGGTNDMDPPRVFVERRDGAIWAKVAGGPSRDLVVLFEPPDRWSAEWQRANAQPGERLRFRVEGVYRGATPGASEPHPLWDPDGRNAGYEALSREFQVDA